MSKELFLELTENEIKDFCVNTKISVCFSPEEVYDFLQRTYEDTTLLDEYANVASELRHASAEDHLSGAYDILLNRQDIILLKMDVYLLKRSNYCR